MLAGNARHRDLDPASWLNSGDIAVVPIEAVPAESFGCRAKRFDSLGVADLVEHTTHHGKIGALVGHDARLNHALPRHDGKVERMAALSRQLFQEHALRAAIALAKWMDC